MKLRHLRYLVAGAEELHSAGQRERLHVAQPAVSEQVRKLEQQLGVKLFDRNQRSVELTVAGVALLEEARHVLRHAEVAQQAARNAGDLVTMRLRVGYLPDSLPASVPRALRRLAGSALRVDVDLTTGRRSDSSTKSVSGGSTLSSPVCLHRRPAPREITWGAARRGGAAGDPPSRRHLGDRPRAAGAGPAGRASPGGQPQFRNAMVAMCHRP